MRYLDTGRKPSFPKSDSMATSEGLAGTRQPRKANARQRVPKSKTAPKPSDVAFWMGFYAPITPRHGGRQMNQTAKVANAGDVLVNGRQLRGARVTALMSQEELGDAIGYSGRAIREWERREYGALPCVPEARKALVKALANRGVIVFADPTPGSRLAE